MDEADLVFSYGYEDDVKAVLRQGREGGAPCRVLCVGYLSRIVLFL